MRIFKAQLYPDYNSSTYYMCVEIDNREYLLQALINNSIIRVNYGAYSRKIISDESVC